jgi:hypothetical protein
VRMVWQILLDGSYLTHSRHTAVIHLSYSCHTAGRQLAHSATGCL